MSEALIFSIIMLLVSIYAALGTFLNWKSAKKPHRQDEPFTLFDKVLSIILIILSISFLIYVLIKDI